MAYEAAFVRVFNGDPDKGGEFKGTAFFIHTQQLLTAKHVVDACTNGVYLRLPPHGDPVPVHEKRIIRGERDVASLRLNTPATHADIIPVPMSNEPLQTQHDVVLHGFFHVSESLETRSTQISGYLNTRHTWRTALSVKQGMSGGAALCNGELAGIIQARDTEHLLAYIIPLDAIRDCIGELPTYPSNNTSADTDELQRAATVFVGRAAELTQLKTALLGTANTPVAITAVHGMAGVGKSWLADHFYVTHQHLFPGGYQRLALNADNPASAELLLAELAERLEISAPPPKLPQLLQFQLQQPRTLLHVENVDTDAAATVAAQLCSQLTGCAIVLSGRLDNFGKARRWQQVGIKPFQTADALAQLQADLAWLEVAPLKDKDAFRLVGVLGGLPLAIHLAAGYLAVGYDVDAFLHELHATDYDLPPKDAADGLYTRDQARAVLHSTFRISLQELEKQASKRKLLQADQTFAHLGFAPTAGFNSSMATALTDLPGADCQSLLRLAQKLSLLEMLQANPPRWQLHPLLADYLRQHTPDSGSQERLHQWFLQHLPEPSVEEGQEADYSPWHELNNEHTALSEWLANLPKTLHTLAERAGSQYALRNGPFATWMVFCQQALQNADLEDKQRSNILFTLAGVAQRAGDMDGAISAAENKYRLDTQRDEDREAAVAKGQIADILQARGQLDEALRVRQEEELPVYERLGEVRSIAITKGQIADILQARGQLDEALRVRQEEELPVYERLGEVRSIAITKGQIADILQARGQLDEALRVRQEEELPVYERLGEVRSIAITKGQIADILQARGQLDEALRVRQEEELPVYERLGEVRSIAITKGKIADILQARGQLDEALRIRTEDQLPVYERLGEVRSIAITKGKIADILQARGQLDEALRIRTEDQLPVYERLGEVRSIAITKGKIADILQARGQLDEALRIRTEDQLPVYERLGEVRSIAITKGQIADILQARGQLDEALRIRTEDQLPVYERLGEVRSIAITKGQIADILQARGQLDEALRIRTEDQLPVYERLGEVRSIAITKGKIADILQARGQLDEALRIRTEDQLPVYERLGEVRSIAITKGKIADILQARGQLDEALRIRTEDQLPVYERLGEVRSIAITKGKIADILQARGQLDEALRIRTEDQLPVYERLGEVRSIAITKGKIADILQARGQLDEALRIRTEDQLPVYERLGEVRSIAITKGKIADILQARGQLDEALRIRTEDQLPVYERLGEVREIAITKGQIADILQARGQLDEALRIRTEDQLPVYERLGEVREIAITKGQIADILQARGQLDEALRIRTEDQLPVYERLGEVREIAITKGQIADILFLNDKKEDAIKMFEEEFLPLINYLGDKQTLVSAQVSLAIKYLTMGQNIERANQLFCDSLHAAQTMRLPVAGQIKATLQHFGMECG